MSVPTSLIIVCCHGIWTGGPSKGKGEHEWLIADFQKGETDTFAAHARAGIECLVREPDSALAFSGAATRKETKLSEAQSYANLAHANQYWGLAEEVPPNILIEDRALDSYHNILFSITLFYSRFSVWPQRITIVSHGFKRLRVLHGHCVAIGYPLDRIHYVGIDPPGMEDASNFSVAGVEQAKDEWTLDPHGRDASLACKRERRNPWHVSQGVFPQESELNDNCGLMIRHLNGGETLDEDAPRPWM
ncbi:hypothetical protein VHEMI09612 [[Torrubiella] hemipterigena]|uniref:DUF218 domain-containing protein n=1 Tax=[Torrubiella] hemipterigena TaxID=1531966 RepID=A0A0A1TRT1_9HYPO|nr:hypothetical protein VHEMI09612 [[Torrubiella] hemipterigena]